MARTQKPVTLYHPTLPGSQVTVAAEAEQDWLESGWLTKPPAEPEDPSPAS